MIPDDPHSPLMGLRVLDASRVLAGPFCGQMLGDLGAEVIKVERPGLGDDTRGWGPPYLGPLSAYFLSCNRNKRSLALDIQKPEGHVLFDRLLAKSDILIENFRSDSAEKLGLSPETLLARHPKLVICSISGFGRSGSLKDVPGYDFAIQALSGLMSITGPADGSPHKVGVAVADILTGLYSAVAILAAIHARKRSGHGYAIDIALHDCALAAQVNVAQAFLTSGQVPPRQGNAHLQIVPYQLFETADGALVLAVGNDSQWRSFCKVAGEEELGTNPLYAENRSRVERRRELVPQVADMMKRHSNQEWERRLLEANVPHALVRDYAAVFRDSSVLERGMKITVRDPDGNDVDLIGNPMKFAGAFLPEPTLPPRLGAESDRILGELLGLDAAACETLRQQGVT